MDAFFASIEERDKPWLKTQPMVVAGRSNRGIITTANYEARKYGLHSAMPIFMAKKLCPQVKIVGVDKNKYIEVSRQIHKIFLDLTPYTEMVSLDEAYLDLYHIKEKPLVLANYLKKRIYQETKLTLSIGISYNKFLAKLASDWQKPNGITIISKDMVPDILMDLDIEKVHGLGKVSAEKLHKIGIYKVADLYKLSQDFLVDFLGNFGKDIYERIRGIDNRKVESNQNRKSIGTERTFPENIEDLEVLLKLLDDYAEEVHRALIKSKDLYKTISIKLKNKDFQSKTRSYTLSDYSQDLDQIKIKAKQLLKEAYKKDQYRLLGLSLSNLKGDEERQLSVFE